MIKHLLILSGFSGSGKSTAVRVLEDIGYFCVDNLPPTLIPTFIELLSSSAENITKAALVIDIREGIFFENAAATVKELKQRGYPTELLFLEASDEALVKRYKETRRKHPLAYDGNVLEGVSKERKLLSEIRELADRTIDTSLLNVHQLKEVIQDTFGKPVSPTEKVSVTFLSFGYKYGSPYDADVVFDVRFLPNPYFIDELKDLSGGNEKVRNFVLQSEDAKEFIEKAVDMLSFLIPRYEKEGKTYLTVAIGCTGGKHRSVAIVEELAGHFKHIPISVQHRDINKG